MRRHRPESGGLGRAGAQRLHGPAFRPAGLGLDAKGLQAPSKQKKSAADVIVEKCEGIVTLWRTRPHFDRGAAS